MLTEKPGFADPHYWAYHTATVNAYARPFTEMKPVGKLPDGVALRNIAPVLLDMHKQILRDRQMASAHSDLSERRVQYVPSGASIGSTKASGGGFVTRKTAWGIGEWEIVRELTMEVGSRVQAEAFRLLEEVYGGLYLPGPIDIPIE